MIYEFTPTQDLHGYSKPWAPGAGINKLDIENNYGPGTIDSTTGENVSNPNYRRRTGMIPISGSVMFTGSLVNDTDPTIKKNIKTQMYVYDLDGAYIAEESDAVPQAAGYVYTVEDDRQVRFVFQISDAATFTHYLPVDFMICESSTPQAYAPYSNICPLEGYQVIPEDEDAIVYAGYVNSQTGELYLRPVYHEYAGEELVGPWMSSLDGYEEGETPTTGAEVVDLGGDLETYQLTRFMLQTLLDSLGIRQHFTDGASLLNSLMDQAQGRVRSEDELLHDSLHVIPIGDFLPIGLTIRPISKDVPPGLPGKFIR